MNGGSCHDWLSSNAKSHLKFHFELLKNGMFEDLNARKINLDDNSYERDRDVPRVFEDLPENWEQFRLYSFAHCKTFFYSAYNSPPSAISPSVYKPIQNPLRSCINPGLISNGLHEIPFLPILFASTDLRTCKHEMTLKSPMNELRTCSRHTSMTCVKNCSVTKECYCPQRKKERRLIRLSVMPRIGWTMMAGTQLLT